MEEKLTCKTYTLVFIISEHVSHNSFNIDITQL